MWDSHMNFFVKYWMEIMRGNEYHLRIFNCKMYNYNIFDDTFRHMYFKVHMGDYPKCYTFRNKGGMI